MERYSRQLQIPQIGMKGQNALEKSSVLVAGAGGLGSILSFCLAGAGVGLIGIADYDLVSTSNLNRQFLHTEQSLHMPKTHSAVERLRSLNSDIRYHMHDCRINAANAQTLIEEYDLVFLAVDNLEARIALNNACIKKNKPLINGAVDGMYGSLQIVEPGKTACLACAYRENVKKASATSFAPVVSVISALMAQAGLLILLGEGNPLQDAVLHFDGVHMQFEEMPLLRNPACTICAAK